MKLLALILTPLVILLSGCSSSNSGSQSESMTESQLGEQQEQSLKSDFVFMSDFVEALQSKGVECLDYKRDPDVLLVKEEGTCTHKNVQLTLDLFGDAEQARTLVESLKGLGGYWLTSDNNWVIVVEDESIAKELQALLDVKVL